ncbi:MAG: hypothetical protein AB1757_23630 [Acidobacteriota bacterium]
MMKQLIISARRIFAVGLLAAIAMSVPALAYSIQDKNKPAQPSADEQKALSKVQNAPTLAAKLEAAKEYMKKYSKGVERFKLAQYMVAEVAKSTDAATQISSSETLMTIFNDPKETLLISGILIDGYVKATRGEDAFRVGATHLEKAPGDVAILTQLSIFGIEQAKRGNANFVQQSQTYGAKAIELIEADKMPENFEAATWTEYKTRWLPQLYQSLGIVSYMMKNTDDAQAKLEKAASLNPNDPFTYAILGTLANDEYQKYAQQYKNLMAGPVKDEALKRAHTKMDAVIDYFAHAVGLAEGNTAYQALHDQLMEDLKTYYQARKGSLDGLQELINKYKKQ